MRDWCSGFAYAPLKQKRNFFKIQIMGRSKYDTKLESPISHKKVQIHQGTGLAIFIKPFNTTGNFGL